MSLTDDEQKELDQLQNEEPLRDAMRQKLEDARGVLADMENCDNRAGEGLEQSMMSIGSQIQKEDKGEEN
ncbi:hypothetical protein KGQ71_03085 [Patescibacteria group bacterium]|nr:hypothetical protein [Patescibacteria group bacterium]